VRGGRSVPNAECKQGLTTRWFRLTNCFAVFSRHSVGVGRKSMRRAVVAIALMIASASVMSAANSPPDASEPDGVMAAPGTREALQNELSRDTPISRHLEDLKEPKRRVEARAIGLVSSALDEPLLLVIGPITDQELRQVMVVRELEASLSKVVGDMKYARLYFGDPNKDPCCFGEWTYSKESGEWQLISKYERSH
jgi:hypothetical protein